MNRKVFKAENIQQAIANIKEELGSDAMILSTKKIPKKLSDPYSKTMFEVEAVLPGTVSKTVPSRADVMESIKDDIAQIKDMISIAGFGNGMQNMVCNHFESVGILASLLRAGVSEPLASNIIHNASAVMDDNIQPDEKILSLKKYVMRQCLTRIETKDFFSRNNNSGVPHVAAFVGPTGVGKTTTIAKLAAMLTFQRKMKVGLISIDNYRVGAFEQLKAYASIMGVACVPAFCRQDLSCALDRMRSMDMVLIDTAGHSHFDKLKLDEILKLIHSDFAISTHLVLSVTSESIIIKDAASAFSIFNPETVVFTKIDEIKRCGKILDHLCDMKLPVSLVANGQRVPEDLIVPDNPGLLKIILGKGSKEKDDVGSGKRTAKYC
ncbi:MAG: protein FlhF [Proteobacteria bacterium]|nr:protein FlhF [Pseudomonadota bacterium]MBU1388946.1 protein FlhF [Pseudomonadota bacterium]MBU1543498.1 protein FlhF [Pseudomonadota bacterium]MBU2430200.1 protein FlhF [Pseudomonadota bacterium]MBU2482625.1 protein FlhF [Pseudomonadota bacterium]